MGRNSQRRRSARAARTALDARPDLSEISRVRAQKLLRADIATWMQNPPKGPGGSFIEGERPSDPTMVWAILMAWLVGAKEQISEDQARDAVEWVSDSLGIQHDDLLQAAGFIGHPDAPSLTLNQAVDHYGDPIAFTLYMVLLCGGLVATVGDADPEWLKQFDLVS
ncbi:hypothetical protein [Streptomyces sp. SP18CM02]|uniref:hypothetical protein n=1 Tax=Streptomyces sp. SP18CM02 TaxID=2758571 RepID=UPI001CC2DDCE|nr:hypothetical protein [Streptomyces sp. SP18CM02]